MSGACSAGCPTGDHETYGACLRAKRLQLDRHALAEDTRADKRKDASLARYRDMRAAGIQPEAPTKTEMDRAEAVFNAHRSATH